LIYEKNKAGSEEPNQHTDAFHTESPNLHGTLMLLDFIIRKYLRNPIKPVFFDKKLNDPIKTVEKQIDRINYKMGGVHTRLE